jgi:hypothetical protein
MSRIACRVEYDISSRRRWRCLVAGQSRAVARNRKRRARCTWASQLLLCGWLAFTPSAVFGWMINEDYQQRDNRNATDFHIILAGDVRDRITGGGTTSVTNPFADPKLTKSMTTIGNTEVKFEGSNSIPKSTDVDRHFGIFGTGAKPKVQEQL